MGNTGKEIELPHASLLLNLSGLQCAIFLVDDDESQEEDDGLILYVAIKYRKQRRPTTSLQDSISLGT